MIARGLMTALLFLSPVVFAGEGKYSIKTESAPPPKELAPAIQKLLGDTAITLLDPAGKAIGQFWFRPEVPVDATPAQIKNGLTYREIKQSEILGAARFENDWRDYRKQKIKAGVYTLRLAYQPSDGDHMGSSDFQDFLLIIDAAKDTKTDLMEPKAMVDLSMKTIGTGHPAVFMLFPGNPTKTPELDAKPKHHWVLNTRGEIVANGKKAGAPIGISVTVVGAAE